MTDELDRYDEILAAAPRGAVRLPPFDAVLARDRRSRTRTVLAAATIGLALVAGASLALLRDRYPAAPPSAVGDASLARLAIPPGLAYATAARGGAVFVWSGGAVLIVDPDGRTLARFDEPVRYPRWLPDGSGVLAQSERAGAGADLALPLVVLERDGRITRLATSLSGRAFAGAVVSADVRMINAFDGDDVVTIPRDGGPVSRRPRANAVVLLEQYVSPDGSVTVGPDLPRGVLGPHWIGGHELLARDGDGMLEAVDPTSGTRRPLGLRLDANAALGVRGVSDDVLCWITPGTDVAELADVRTGERRRALGVPSSASVQPLGSGRFLVASGSSASILSFR